MTCNLSYLQCTNDNFVYQIYIRRKYMKSRPNIKYTILIFPSWSSQSSRVKFFFYMISNENRIAEFVYLIAENGNILCLKLKIQRSFFNRLFLVKTEYLNDRFLYIKSYLNLISSFFQMLIAQLFTKRVYMDVNAYEYLQRVELGSVIKIKWPLMIRSDQMRIRSVRT